MTDAIEQSGETMKEPNWVDAIAAILAISGRAEAAAEIAESMTQQELERARQLTMTGILREAAMFADHAYKPLFERVVRWLFEKAPATTAIELSAVVEESLTTAVEEETKAGWEMSETSARQHAQCMASTYALRAAAVAVNITGDRVRSVEQAAMFTSTSARHWAAANPAFSRGYWTRVREEQTLLSGLRTIPEHLRVRNPEPVTRYDWWNRGGPDCVAARQDFLWTVSEWACQSLQEARHRNIYTEPPRIPAVWNLENCSTPPLAFGDPASWHQRMAYLFAAYCEKEEVRRGFAEFLAARISARPHTEEVERFFGSVGEKKTMVAPEGTTTEVVTRDPDSHNGSPIPVSIPIPKEPKRKRAKAK